VPLLVGRVFSGLSAGSFAGTATATLIDLAPARGRQRAAAIAVGVTLGGLGFGNLLSGLLAQIGVVPLRFPYWAHLALLLPAVPAVFFAPETVKVSPHPRFRPQRLAVPKEVRGTFAPAALGGFSAFACPEERRGEVNATFYVVLYMGLCVSIVGVGLLSEVTGLRTAGIVLACVVTGLASAAALSLLLRDRRPVA